MSDNRIAEYEAGSCCLGSRNLGCLEVGRLARSPSWLRAVEGAAC